MQKNNTRESHAATLSRIKKEMDRPRIVKSARKHPEELTKSRADRLLENHRAHFGLYRRLAARLRVDPSLVSRVAHNRRDSKRILKALVEELERLRMALREMDHD